MAAKRNLAIFALLGLFGLAVPISAQAARIGDLVTLAGSPENQLIGYGLVVGLPGTGDQTTEIPYTQQSILNMLTNMGMSLPNVNFMQPDDVASVMVTARIPPYSSQGQQINVTVSALGNASSLAGGILLPTPLKGGNGMIYAQGEGAILVSGFATGNAGGSSKRVNVPTVGEIPHGAIMSRTIPSQFSRNGIVDLLVDHPSFTTASRIASAIDRVYGRWTAQAISPGDVRVRSARMENDVAFMSDILNLDVVPRSPSPTVVVDAQSGTIVMGAGVTLGPAVVAHGNLTVTIQAINGVSQPNPFAGGTTVGVRNTAVSAKQKKAKILNLPKTATLADVARVLNAVGATPSDLISIIEALKEAGAINAKLKVI